MEPAKNASNSSTKYSWTGEQRNKPGGVVRDGPPPLQRTAFDVIVSELAAEVEVGEQQRPERRRKLTRRIARLEVLSLRIPHIAIILRPFREQRGILVMAERGCQPTDGRVGRWRIPASSRPLDPSCRRDNSRTSRIRRCPDDLEYGASRGAGSRAALRITR